MKRYSFIVLTLAAAAFLAACGAPATNTGNAVNTANTNAAKPPATAPPTLAALKDLETKAFEAWKNKDGKFFEGFLADNFVMADEKGNRLDKAASVKEISSHPCEVKSFAFSDEKMTMAGPDVAIVTMKVAADGTCMGEKLPSPVISASVYTRSGDTWKAAYHNEVPVIDPKAPAPPKKAEAKKEAPKPPATTAANSNANTASAAKPDALADTLLALEKKAWDAWKAKDAKALEDSLAKDMMYVDLFGNVTATKAEVIKSWTEHKCEIKSVSVTGGHAVLLTPTTALLMFKGAGDGSCEGMALKPVWGTTIFIKEGDAWKAVYGFETPAA